MAIISPVKPMIYVALLAIIIDTFFGIWRSVKKGVGNLSEVGGYHTL